MNTGPARKMMPETSDSSSHTRFSPTAKLRLSNCSCVRYTRVLLREYVAYEETSGKGIQAPAPGQAKALLATATGPRPTRWKQTFCTEQATTESDAEPKPVA